MHTQGAMRLAAFQFGRKTAPLCFNTARNSNAKIFSWSLFQKRFEDNA
jgi:hypothetical protein